jgi:hypothetical protein
MKLTERWIEAAQSEWKHGLARQLLALSYIFAIQQDVAFLLLGASDSILATDRASILR